MNVEKVMTRDVQPCHPDDVLTVPARIMWERDVGAVPVIEAGGKAIAMITDRDIAMAAYLGGTSLDVVAVADAMSPRLYSVRPTDPVELAEEMMRSRQVRRLPVVDPDGRLIGIVTLNDLARAARNASRYPEAAVDPEEVTITLASIAEPRPSSKFAH